MNRKESTVWSSAVQDLELWFQVSLIFFFGSFAWMARSFPGRSKLMPGFVALGSLLLALASLGVYLSRVRHQAEIPSHTAPSNRRNRLHIWMTTLAGVAANLCGGFLLSVAVYFGVFGFLSWGRSGWLRTVVATAVATLLVWYLFGELLQLPLSKGFFF